MRALQRALGAGKVAIFGASKRPDQLGHQIARQLLLQGYEGEVALINPGGGEILGVPFSPYPDDAAGADIAVIAVSAEKVPQVVAHCGHLEIPIAVVVAEGYSETGNRDRERALVETAREYGLRILGPNCLGVHVSATNMNLTSIPALPLGKISAVLQSGGVAYQAAQRMRALGVGFDALINLGNKSDINLTDCLRTLSVRSGTGSIILYVETFDEGDDFVDVLAEVTNRLPVVTLVGGWTRDGSKVAASHTGAILNRWQRLAAVFRDCGALVTTNFAEAIAAAIPSTPGHRRPTLEGGKVFVLCDGGGLSVLLADAITHTGGHLTSPSTTLADSLGSILGRDSGAIRNPLDFAGAAYADARAYPDCLELVVASGEFSAVVVGGSFGGYSGLYGADSARLELFAATRIAEIARQSPIPIIVQTAVATEDSDPIRVLRDAAIPCVEWPEEAVAGLVALGVGHVARTAVVDGSRSGLSSQANSDQEESTEGWDKTLAETTEIVCNALEERNIPHGVGMLVARSQLPATGLNTWVLRADGFRHKSRIGAIAVRVPTSQLLPMYDSLTASVVKRGGLARIRLAPYVDHEYEVLATFWRNSREGSGFAFGAGGLKVEERSDVSAGRLPRSTDDVQRIMSRTKIGVAIAASPSSCEQLCRVILELADVFMEQLTELAELEINPIGIGADGPVVLDILPTSDG